MSDAVDVHATCDRNTEWDKTFGGSEDDLAYSVQQTADGGYILGGSTLSYGAGVSDAWLVKTDADGNTLWDKTFGGSEDDVANSVQQTADGGYILGGYTYSYGAAGDTHDAWLVKTDADGNIVWDKTFGGSGAEEANSVQQTADGGYILGGYTYSYGAGESDAWLVKTDADGNTVWDTTFGGSEQDGANSVQQTADGGYILGGHTRSYGVGDADAWLIKTDADGNIMWDKTFGGSDNDDEVYSVQQTVDGGYILGVTYGAREVDAWLIKTDSDGNTVWDTTFGGSEDDEANSVQQTVDGGYILGGHTRSYGEGHYDAWLIKTDADGNTEWDKTFGGSEQDGANSVQQTADGGYILGGHTRSYGVGDADAWLVKTCGL